MEEIERRWRALPKVDKATEDMLKHVAPPRISTIAHPELFIIDSWLEDVVLRKFATNTAYDVLTGISLLASLWHLPEQADTDTIKAKLERAKDTGWAPRTRAVSWFRGSSLRARDAAEKKAIEKCAELMQGLIELENSIIHGKSDVAGAPLQWLHDRDDVERLAEFFAWAGYSAPNLTTAIKKLDMESLRYHSMWAFIGGIENDARLVASGLRSQEAWWRKIAVQD